jgi:shikimate dehydrogenase
MKPDWQLGLIGWPLGHSLSPLMHSASLRSAGLDGAYRLYPVPPLPEGESLLAELLAKIRTGELDGLNVTIPHKQHVILLLDSLTPAARAIGAVNTISKKNGLLTGDNTDWLGFSRDLSNVLPEIVPVPERKALILGAGGSARAVVYALVQSGWQITLAARRVEQARQLVEEFTTTETFLSAAALRDLPDLSSIRLIVNTTPVGMSPKMDETPWPAGISFPRRAFLYDLIYNPAETTLMKAARVAGLSASNGLGMLAGQAALAFEIWTGLSVSVEIFHQAALERTLS